MSFADIKRGNIYKYFTNGEWKFSNSKKTISINSPTNGSLIGKVQAVTKKEIDETLSYAKKAQKDWENLPVNKRAEILNKAADLILKNKKFIADLLTKEISKARSLSMNEVERTAYLIKGTAEEGLRIREEIVEGESFYKTEKNKKAFVSRVPFGVVLAISPFNYPINLSCSKIAPALISGNSVVLKPSTQGAISVLHIAELFSQAGLPPGVLGVVTGNAKEIGDYLVKHKDVDMIAFTGSTKIGKRISNLIGLRPMLLELGGKDAAIVLEDADLKLAVKECVSGCFSYSGQRCTAIKRIVLVNSIADKFVNDFVKEVKKLKCGKPESDAFITPLINNKAADYVEELVKDAVNKGAKKILSGLRKKNFVEPMVLDFVNKKCRIYYEEQFGPVAVIIRVKDEKEAIDAVNDSKYGLQADIFTENINRAFAIATKLEVGTVQVNGRSDRGPDNFPFDCIKDSGIGTQGIRYSIEAMTRIKSVVLNTK